MKLPKWFLKQADGISQTVKHNLFGIILGIFIFIGKKLKNIWAGLMFAVGFTIGWEVCQWWGNDIIWMMENKLLDSSLDILFGLIGALIGYKLLESLFKLIKYISRKAIIKSEEE